MNETFRELHESGCFVMPNPWSVGSARVLQSLGFSAVATTSSGHAMSLGKLDQHVSRAEMLGHATDIVGAVDVPVNVDSERCFASDLGDLAGSVDAIAATGAAGFSIEDYDPITGAIDPIDAAAERVGGAADAARRHGLVLTGRAENHLYGIDDLDDTIARLVAYRDAGADVVYAPGLVAMHCIERVVRELEVPVSVLAWPGGPNVEQLATAGVRRVSTGGALARAAFGALIKGASELLVEGTYARYTAGAMTDAEMHAAFTDED